VNGEIAARALPAVPDASAFGDLLGQYMQVTQVSTDMRAARPYLIVQGLLKASPGAASPAAQRRSLLDSLEAIMVILDTAGVRHHHHPELVMYGKAHREDDGSQGSGEIECLAKISLYRSEDAGT